MSTILYVDNIQENHGYPVGRVITYSKVMRILELIEANMGMITDIMAQLNNVQYVQRAGRFLVSTTLALDAPQYKYQMVLADIKDDETLARSFAASLKSPELIQLAFKLFNELHYLSDEERNKFEMEVGDEK